MRRLDEVPCGREIQPRQTDPQRHGQGEAAGIAVPQQDAGRHAAVAEQDAPLAGGDRLTFAGDAVFAVGFDHPDWYNSFEHDPEEAARVRVRLLRELAATREPLVATHLSFPSVCHVAVDGDVFRWVPGPWEY